MTTDLFSQVIHQCLCGGSGLSEHGIIELTMHTVTVMATQNAMITWLYARTRRCIILTKKTRKEDTVTFQQQYERLITPH
jgi:hypothetical protein